MPALLIAAFTCRFAPEKNNSAWYCGTIHRSASRAQRTGPTTWATCEWNSALKRVMPPSVTSS